MNGAALSSAANSLLKREPPSLVAATGLFFRGLGEVAEVCAVSNVVDCRGGVWGEATAEGAGYPILRSTNMRGARVDVRDPAWCDVPNSQAEMCSLQSGDVLVTKASGSSDLVGKAALFVHPGNDLSYLFSNFVLRLRPKPNIVLPEYLAWFLRSPQSLLWRFEAQQNAVGLRNLQTKGFLAQSLPVPDLKVQAAVVSYLDAVEQGSDGLDEITLPPPLHEQRRIVARIEELAGKVEEARGLRRQADKEADAVFASAMNGIWSRQSEWSSRPIREVARAVSGQVDPRFEPYASLPHINGEAMESGTCRLLSYRLAKDDGVTSGKYHFLPGAILYSKIRPYLRKAVEVPVEGVCSADVYAFEWIDPEVRPRFFMYSLVAPGYTEFANRVAGRTRMPKINQDQMFGYRLPYPPMPEQDRIVCYLDGLQAKANALKRLQAETTKELNALLPSVLDKAFRGEL